MALPYQLDDQQVLEEDYDENYEPTEEEVLEYCKVLGLDPATERDLLYIAREGIKAPLPTDWKPIENSKDGSVYYFNFTTGESTWEHPCDEFYRKLLQQEREKRGSTEQDNMTTKTGGGKKKAITLKGKAPLTNGGSGPARGDGGTAPLGKLTNKPGSPGHSRLAPLSIGAGKPLPSIGGLPPLKGPPSLAPLRPPPSMSQGGSLGNSLTTTGGSRISDPLGGSSKGGEIDFGSVRISTQFEEEDSETETDSQGGGFKSKLAGMNLLGAADLGLKESEEDLDSTEDVSKELRKIMDISSDKEEHSEPSERGVARPTAPVPQQRGGGVGESPVSSPRFQRPGAARLRESPVNSGSSSPAGLRVRPAGRGVLSSPAIIRLGQTEQTVSSEVNQSVQNNHQATLNKLRPDHDQELAKLKQELAGQLEVEKSTLQEGNEAKLVAFREQLVREQLSEEKKLRAEKMAAVNEVRSRVSEEREDEEARMEEEKTDYLRKLKQQLSNERDREERRLRDETSKSLGELRDKLKLEQEETESDIRSKADRELTELKERLTKEVEAERERVRVSLEAELEAVREGHQNEVQTKREEMEREHQQQLEEIQGLREKQEQELQAALAELKQSSSLDKVKSDALEAHQQALDSIQSQLATELESKREEVNGQHEQEMESLLRECEEELSQTRKQWEEKIAQEKQRLCSELNSTKEVLQQDHDEAVQSLTDRLQTAKAELEQQAQQQSEQLATLEAEHSTKMADLQQLTEQVTQEQAQLEQKRTRLAKEEELIKSEEKRLEEVKKDKRSQLAEDEALKSEEKTELKAAVETERESLAEIKRSHEALQSEVQELLQKKHTLQSSLEQLQAEVKGQILALEEVKKEREVLVEVSAQRGAVEAATEHRPSGEEGAESADLLVDDLEPPVGLKERLEQGQRELHSALSREQQSLEQTKQYLNDQGTAPNRKSGARRAHKRHRDYEQSVQSEDNNLTLLKEIRAKLDQEAAVLRELEDKMRSTDTHRTQGESSDGNGQFDGLSDEDSPPLHQLTSDVPCPKTYLTKLQSSLERSRRYTQSQRSRHLSSPLPMSSTSPTPNTHSTAHTHHTLHSSSDGSSSEDDDVTSSAHEHHRPHTRSTPSHLTPSRFSPATHKIMKDSLKHVASEKKEQSVIYESLNLINCQLGQLLQRLPESGSTQVATESLASSGIPSLSNSRWADPVQRLPLQPDLELTEKRRSYLSSQPNTSSTASSFGNSQLRRSPASVRPQPSTEELIHSQTDWLKEFRQSVPLSSQQTLRSRPPSQPSSNPAKVYPTVQRGVLPSKPKLVLDTGNNVKLVHVLGT